MKPTLITLGSGGDRLTTFITRERCFFSFPFLNHFLRAAAAAAAAADVKGRGWETYPKKSRPGRKMVALRRRTWAFRQKEKEEEEKREGGGKVFGRKGFYRKGFHRENLKYENAKTI